MQIGCVCVLECRATQVHEIGRSSVAIAKPSRICISQYNVSQSVRTSVLDCSDTAPRVVCFALAVLPPLPNIMRLPRIWTQFRICIAIYSRSSSTVSCPPRAQALVT